MENPTTNTMPEGFTGVFSFTNWTDEEFTDKWNSVEYTFPAHKTVPLIIPNETQEGIQSIRKKFARTLGEREFYKSEKGKFMNSKDAGPRPAGYTETDIAPYIQKCLEPLEPAIAQTRVVPSEADKVLTRDKKGNPRTNVLDEDDSLVGDGQVVA